MMVEANRTAAIHQRRFGITRRGETAEGLSVNSLGRNSAATSHPFAPAGIVVSLHLDRDRAIGVLFLLRSPGNRPEDAGANLDLGGKMNLAGISLRQQERALATVPAIRMSRIERTTQFPFRLRAFDFEPKDPRHVCHPAIRNRN